MGKKNLSIHIEKLHKMALIISFFFLFLEKFEKTEEIGYHSNFECNTERGFKESLSIALGLLAL